MHAQSALHRRQGLQGWQEQVQGLQGQGLQKLQGLQGKELQGLQKQKELQGQLQGLHEGMQAAGRQKVR